MLVKANFPDLTEEVIQDIFSRMLQARSVFKSGFLMLVGDIDRMGNSDNLITAIHQ